MLYIQAFGAGAGSHSAQNTDTDAVCELAGTPVNVVPVGSAGSGVLADEEPEEAELFSFVGSAYRCIG